VEALAILGRTADGDTSKTFPRKISTKTGEKKEATVSSLMPARYTFIVLEKHDDDNLNTEGRLGDQVCLLTIHTGA
jgi:hypothetical protein